MKMLVSLVTCSSKTFVVLERNLPSGFVSISILQPQAYFGFMWYTTYNV